MFELLSRKINNRKGFTLIELIVVIAIIAILAAVLIPRFTGFTDEARKKATLSDARNILVALEAMEAQGALPATPADATTDVNTYVGKNIITVGPAVALTDGNSRLTAVGSGINFTYEKRIGTTTYTASCVSSVITVS